MAGGDLHPRAEVAGVHARRHARHAPQRGRHARGDREAARERGQHGERPREQELVAHRALGAVRGRRRLADAEARDRSSVAARDPHQQLDATAVGKLVEAVAGRRGQEVVRGLVLLALLRAALALVGRREPEQLGLVAHRASARGHDEEDVAGGPERLIGEIGASARGDRRRLATSRW